MKRNEDWHEELMKRIYKKCYYCIHFPVCEFKYFKEDRKNCKDYIDKRKVVLSG